jgi:hypothetical protein
MGLNRTWQVTTGQYKVARHEHNRTGRVQLNEAGHGCTLQDTTGHKRTWQGKAGHEGTHEDMARHNKTGEKNTFLEEQRYTSIFRELIFL